MLHAVPLDPIVPGWIKPLIQPLAAILEETRGSRCTADVTITFEATSPDTAKWSEVVTRKHSINVKDRYGTRIPKDARNGNGDHDNDNNLRRATFVMLQATSEFREDLLKDELGCRQIILVVKEGRLAGIKTTRSVPVRDMPQERNY